MAIVHVRAKLSGVSPLSFSKAILEKRDSSESHDVFEKRTWRQRLHVTSKGECYIPPQAIKNCLSDVAKFLGESVKGKGKSTFTKHFDAGVMVVDPVMLGINQKDVESEDVFVPSDGKKNGGTRVWKTFPMIYDWSGETEIILLDPILADNPDKVHEYLTKAGQFIGLGRWRPRNGGMNGRFKVDSFKVVK